MYMGYGGSNFTRTVEVGYANSPAAGDWLTASPLPSTFNSNP